MDNFYVSAKDLMNKGKYQEAFAVFLQGKNDKQKTIGSYTENINDVHLLAQNCDNEAQYLYGCYLEFVKKDYVQACDWYERAAKDGNADAMFNLADCYYFGREADNLWDTINRYRSNGGFGLGFMARNTSGDILTDKYKASRYLIDAAESGNSDAQNNLGYCYYFGEGNIQQSYAEAKKWFKKSADQGNAYGQNNLARYYLNNTLDRGYDEAKSLYEMSAAQGNADAQLDLGVCYENGLGTPKDFNEAVKNYTKAIENIDARDVVRSKAYFLRGQLYVDEVIKHKHLKDALEDYKNAKKYGYDCAAKISALESALGLTKDTSVLGAFSQDVKTRGVKPPDLYAEVENMLKENFGDQWDLLQDQSKKCLITGCITYVTLLETGFDSYANIDFSAAIIPMTKACEIEFGRIFFEKFLDYLEKYNVDPKEFKLGRQNFIGLKNVDSMQEIIGEHEGYAIIKQKKFSGPIEVAYKDKTSTGVYSLGSFAYYADIVDDNGLRYKRYNSIGANKEDAIDPDKISVDPHILAFVDKIFKDKYSEQQNKMYLYYFDQKTKRLADELRNRAAHSAVMTYQDAIYCGNLIISSGGILKEFIDRIKPEYLN